MRILTSIGLLAAAALFSSASSAGNFNVWTYNTEKNQTHVEISFAGDGITQEAQLDLSVPAGFRLVEAKSLVSGSVCAGSEKAGLLRAVPPSGEGKPLTSKETNYCRFVLARLAKASGPLTFDSKLTECVGAGATSCSFQVQDVSENSNRPQNSIK